MRATAAAVNSGISSVRHAGAENLMVRGLRTKVSIAFSGLVVRQR